MPPKVFLRLIVWSVTVAIATLCQSAAQALPGEVLGEQKISFTTGGLSAALDDNDQFGISAVGIGDLDRDGVEDAAVGAWLDDDGGTGRGAVWILFLNTNGTVKSEQKISQTSGGFAGVLTDNGNFGGTIAPLGDLDGDGIVDLAVSAHNDDTDGANRGSLWILFLNTDGTVKNEQRIAEGSGGFTGTLVDNDHFGLGVSAIGDLDENGSIELAVGVYSDDDGTAESGSVWILFMLPDGTLHHEQKISETEGNLGVIFDSVDRFGISTAGLGDVDGDGVPDLAVAADRDDDGGTDRGSVYILFLEQDGSVKSRQKISDTAGGFSGVLADSDHFGFGIAAVGDVDGDLVPDLAVGAYGDNDNGNDRGAVWILFLNTDGTVSGHQKISDLAGGFGGVIGADRFGGSVGGLGDLDGDGIGDLVVGAYVNDDGGNNRGAVWILDLDGSPLTCGNGVLDPVEECDDGNTMNFDGCTAVCEVEDDLKIFGIAETAGLLSVENDGAMVNVGVSSGDTPSVLASLLEIVLNATPALAALGTNAQSVDGVVYSNGRFASGGFSGDGVSISINPGRVLGIQKISDTQGNFTGVLDNGDDFGASVASLGDLNGDGIGDIVVGADGDDDGGGFGNQGAVWVLFLNADGTVNTQQKISDTQGGLTGILDNLDSFGGSVAALGDLNGDGIGDLAVGAPGDDDGGAFDDLNRGAVWVLFLNADGTVNTVQKISDTQGGFTGILVDFDLFGSSVASLGDVNGDGIGDLVVGAPGDGDGAADSDRGAVWVLFLNPDGTVNTVQKISDTQGGFTGILDNFDLFGSSVASLGDVNGDGISDVLVGAIGDDDGAAGGNRGAVWVLFLNPDGTVNAHQKISDTQGGFTGILNNFDVFGSSVASLGDLDGDGISDVLVGAIGDDDGAAGSSRGAFWVLFLNPDGTVKAHQKTSDTQGDFSGILDGADLFGSSAVSLGDLNGDGIGNLAVGAKDDDDGGLGRGAVWVLSLDGAPPPAPPVCGDGQILPPETCDDGNTSSGDGCYQTCKIEDGIQFSGVAQGGTIIAELSGVVILVVTTAGQDAAMVASNLADAINLTPGLQTQGISSLALASLVVSDGIFGSVTSTDPGIFVPEPGLPIMLAAGILGLTALSNRQRAKRRPA